MAKAAFGRGMKQGVAMRYAKSISLILLFLPFIVLASDETVPPNGCPPPMLLFGVIVFCSVCLVLVGIGIVLALAGLAFSALLVRLALSRLRPLWRWFAAECPLVFGLFITSFSHLLPLRAG
jgi:hypothetical protein